MLCKFVVETKASINCVEFTAFTTGVEVNNARGVSREMMSIS